MKKTAFTLVFLMSFVMFTFAQKSWVDFTSSNPQLPVVQIEQQDASKLVLDISVPGMFVTNVTEEGTNFQLIELSELNTQQEVGMPQLPMINEVIGIPVEKLARFNIIEMTSIKLSDYTIYPFQTPSVDVQGGKSEQFVINNEFYNSDKSFPSENVVLAKPGIWRDVKVSGFHFTPFTYNPSTKELEVITSLKVEIEFYGTDSENLFTRSKEITPKFYNMYEKAISNFNSLGYTVTTRDNTDIKYLIITNTEAVDAIQPLSEWKNQQGYKVEVRTMEPGFNTPQNFKDYVTELYDNGGLEYILMVGDAYPNGGNGGGSNDVPMYWWAPSGEDGSYSDSWYTMMDGPDDHYADIAIGRFVYDNMGELELQIQKTMDYYLNPDASTNWAENVLLIAHEQLYPGKYTACKEEIRNFNYALQNPIFTQCYGGAGASNNDIVNWVNSHSGGYFNYRGHGSATAFTGWNGSNFTASNVNQFTNNDRLFVCTDVCCDNMDIVAHSGNCLCESFMKSPVAAVAINGAIIPSYTIPNHDYDKEMYKAVFEEGIFNIGYVTNFANVTVLNVHGTIGRSNVRTYLWLGDASIEAWTLQPTELLVNHDAQLFLGLSEFSVTVNGNGGPVENARVCISNADGSIYAIGFTDGSGVVTVMFDSPVQDPGVAMVTVSSNNFLPYQAEIPVIPLDGPYIVKDSYEINDASGNANGMMDYGESILLSLTMKNVGLDEAVNVDVTISTDDDYITITDGFENFGNIAPESTVTVVDGYAFDVANDIPDGHFVLFMVSATDGSSVWESNFSIEGHAPIIGLGAVVILDPSGNNNGKVDPGETVDLVIDINNTGTSDAYNVIGELLISDPYVVINSATQNYGNIVAGGTMQQTFNITAGMNTPAGHIATFEFNMAADLGITGTGEFMIVIGQIPVLILDLDPDHSSGPEMQTSITNLGVSSERLTALPADLNLYSSIFVCLGVYSTNHVLSSAEGQALANFLNNGGMLYMEGGDTWYYDASTAVHSMFNINPQSDGSSDLGIILGQTGTFTEGMSFNYSGANSWIDHIAAIAPADLIFKNQSPSYGCGVAYDEGSYNTIGCSYEFGGLDDSDATKDDLMEQYLIFFGIAPGGDVTQNIELMEGYQFISSRIEVENPDMLVVLQNILNENLDFVRNSNGTILRKIGPNWVNGIGDWITTEGYLFKMFGGEILEITGEELNPITPIDLFTGYQFVSYLPLEAIDALVAFEGILTDDLDYIRNSNGEMLRKIGPNWVNGLGDLAPGEGYLVKMFADDELVYNIPVDAAKSSVQKKVIKHFTFEGGNAADPVYTIYISGLNIGDEVAAYDGNIMVGSTVIRSENTLENSLPIFSTLTSQKGYVNGNDIALKVWDNQSQSQVSSTYALVDDYEEAYTENTYPAEDGEFSVINMTKASSNNFEIDANVSIYPNPASDVLNVIANTNISRVRIINFIGQTMFDNNVNNSSININTSTYQSGVYIISVETSNGVSTEKITIK